MFELGDKVLYSEEPNIEGFVVCGLNSRGCYLISSPNYEGHCGESNVFVWGGKLNTSTGIWARKDELTIDIDLGDLLS